MALEPTNAQRKERDGFTLVNGEEAALPKLFSRAEPRLFSWALQQSWALTPYVCPQLAQEQTSARADGGHRLSCGSSRVVELCKGVTCRHAACIRNYRRANQFYCELVKMFLATP